MSDTQFSEVTDATVHIEIYFRINSISHSSCGTGLLVRLRPKGSRRSILCVCTCKHVLSNRTIAAESRMLCSQRGLDPIIMRLDPKLLYIPSASLDLIVCAVKSPHEDVRAATKLCKGWTCNTGTIVALLSHRSVRRKVWHSARILLEAGNLVIHDCNTRGGTSGAPICNSDGRIVAIHNARNILKVRGENVVCGEGDLIAPFLKELSQHGYDVLSTK